MAAAAPREILKEMPKNHRNHQKLEFPKSAPMMFLSTLGVHTGPQTAPRASQSSPDQVLVVKYRSGVCLVMVPEAQKARGVAMGPIGSYHKKRVSFPGFRIIIKKWIYIAECLGTSYWTRSA